MSPHRFSRGYAVLSVVALAGLAACGTTAGAPTPSVPLSGGGQPARGGGLPPMTHPSLAQAVRSSTDLGPANESISVLLPLATRDQTGLDALTASGRTVSGAEYARRFGPDPAAVAGVRTALAAAGLVTADWHPGDATLRVSGPASTLGSMFGTRIEDFRAPDGTRFFAPLGTATVPATLRPVVRSVVGLDSWQQVRGGAAPTSRGATPSQVMSFYDIQPLRDQGIDGSGYTVFLPETDTVIQSDLDTYAQKFGLPPFKVEVRTDPSWGSADAQSHGEISLDLEIVHSIAPQAKLVVYAADAHLDKVFVMEQAMIDAAVADTSRHTIISSSLGICEDPKDHGNTDAVMGIDQKAAAADVSYLIASGDRGAYGCTPNGDSDTVAPDTEGSTPYVTSVGGTTVFFAAQGGYLKEAGWGEPIEMWGSGGGVSRFVDQPSWQKGPGVQNSASTGKRQTPDVAALGDGLTGWDIVYGGDEHVTGGTSAAAPLWAALMVLVDQRIEKDGLKPVGFLNPAVYAIGASPNSAAPAFHDITIGNNFVYPSTSGWDYVTGWGTPDGVNLAAALETYQRSNPKGSGG